MRRIKVNGGGSSDGAGVDAFGNLMTGDYWHLRSISNAGDKYFIAARSTGEGSLSGEATTLRGISPFGCI